MQECGRFLLLSLALTPLKAVEVCVAEVSWTRSDPKLAGFETRHRLAYGPQVPCRC